MIYIIYIISVLLKISWINFKITFSNVFKEYNRLFFVLHELIFFSQVIMVKNSRFEKDKKIKDVRNLFRLKEQVDDTKINNKRGIFRLEKENEAIKDRVIGEWRRKLS